MDCNKVLKLSDLANATINEVAPHILGRQYFFVFPKEPLFQAALCMIPAIEIFIDGVIVMSDKHPVGRITSKPILKTYLSTEYPECLQVAAERIMTDLGGKIEMDSPLSDALEIFNRTKVAFAPVTEKGSLVSALAIRDILPLIAKSNITTPVSKISSPLKYADKSVTIREAITVMLENNIRKLAVKDKDVTCLLSDRELLDYFVLSEVSHITRVKRDTHILDQKIDHFRMKVPNRVAPETSVSEVAELLMKQSAPVSLLAENSIVTPWDVVMKVLI